MRRWAWLVLCCLLTAGPGWGQESDRPILQMELEAESAIPGQPIVLRVTVLTPTWFPKPPEFPSFEIPNVMIRLPSRAAGPTSQRIGDETWSGVTRAYRIYPMIAGRFRIPPRTVIVTYADPDTREPIRLELATDEIVFSGVVPPEADGLDPFIAATSLTLEHSVEGGAESLEPGQAVTRTIRARIAGTSPIFLPDLIPPLEGEGLAAYPDEPVLTESENRGVLQGERAERVTYLAQSGGRFDLPAISVRWYDLENDRIQTAEVPGLPISVAAEVAAGRAWNWRAMLVWSTAAIGGLTLLGAATWLLWPWASARFRARRAAYRATEAYAYSQARSAVRRHDLGASLSAIDLWRSRLPVADGPDVKRLAQIVAMLGRDRYGSDQPTQGTDRWSQCLPLLRAARRESLATTASDRAGSALPPLNP